MIIKELLNNFDGNNKIQIQMKDGDRYRFDNYNDAILHFGFDRIKHWYIENNILCVEIYADTTNLSTKEE